MKINDVTSVRTILGIDVSKDKSNVAVMFNGKLVYEFVITMDVPGFIQLDEFLNHTINPEIVFEATGVYSISLAYFLQSKKIPYVQLNPLQAKKEMDNLRVNKTDKNDAYHLAGTQFKSRHLNTMIQGPVYTELRYGHRYYESVISEFITEKAALDNALQITFRGVDKLMQTATGPTFWNITRKFPYPDLVKRTSTKELVNLLKESSKNTMSTTMARNMAQKLKDIADTALCSAAPDSFVVDEVRDHSKRLLELQEKKKWIIKKMRKVADGLPEYDVLCSIPGISEITALALISEIGDIRRFKNANQINAFVGIDLMHYESGNSKAPDRISKRGNPYARKVLYQTVINMVSVSRYQNTHINDYYRNKKQSSPNDTKRIVVAAMSRLIRTIHHLVIKNETYDYEVASHANN